MKRRRMLSALCLLLALWLVGCSSGTGAPKTFSAEEMTLTLDDGFTVKRASNLAGYFASRDLAVTVLREDFDTLLDSEIESTVSLREYAGLVMKNNELDAEIVEEDGLTYFVYSRESGTKKYSYLAAVYRSEKAYWLVQFMAHTKDFEGVRERFVTFAGSVSFS